MTLRTPPLRDVHAEHGARFTEFGGWEMPVEFDSIRSEHESVREDAGIFDVSHMGEVEVAGPDAEALMQRLTTNDVTLLDVGDAQYSMITDEDGVILDDTVVYRMPDDEWADFLFVPNAGHDEQMTERWESHREEWGLDAEVRNVTGDYGMVAVQGPNAPDAVFDAASDDAALRDLSRFCATSVEVAGVECWVARTGYTGEDGFELVFPSEGAETLWRAFVDERGVEPCGLGARDTLRIEMGFLLSGQDFDPEEDPRTPYEANVGFTVKLDTEFVGRDALERQKEEGVAERFVGVRLIDRGVPRHGYDVTAPEGQVIGEVTSGTMSPTLNEPIGLGYVDVDFEAGDVVRVVVRGDAKKSEIVTPPFLDR